MSMSTIFHTFADEKNFCRSSRPLTDIPSYRDARTHLKNSGCVRISGENHKFMIFPIKITLNVNTPNDRLWFNLYDLRRIEVVRRILPVEKAARIAH